MIIRNKKQMLSLIRSGMLGNSLRTWKTISEMQCSGYVGNVSMRYSGDHGGEFCEYEVEQETIPEFISLWEDMGADPEKIFLNESAPDEHLLLQGEIMEDWRGLVLTYSTEKGKMRDAMKRGETLYGLSAKIVIENVMSSNSLSDIKNLLDIYSEHVIEFSVYNKLIGNCHHDDINQQFTLADAI